MDLIASDVSSLSSESSVGYCCFVLLFCHSCKKFIDRDVSSLSRESSDDSCCFVTRIKRNETTNYNLFVVYV